MDKNLLNQATAKAQTKWLNELLSETLPELSHLETQRDYQEWFRFLRDHMEDRGLKTPTQQKNFVTDIRNAIKVIDPKHPGLEFIGFDKKTWTEINNQATKVVAERETKFITNPEAIADKARKLIKSDYWSDMAAGLAVVTGRRVSEVLKTAEFSYKTEYSITFSGALKRRQERVECVFEIPTLVKAKEVINALTKLRKHLGKEIKLLSPRQLSGGYSRKVSEVCNREFASLVEKRKDKDNLYTHLFRAVYSTIAAHWYCPPKIPVIEYRAAIQGHYQVLDEKNPQLRRAIAADRNYFDYQIGNGEGNIDGRLGIKLTLPGVKVIEEFANAYSPPPKEKAPKTRKIKKPKANKVTEKTKTTKSKIPSEPRQEITNKSKNKKTMPEIPAFLGSRLEAISQQLELSDTETIKAMFDWVEVSIALAESMELAELDPHLLFEKVTSLPAKSEREEKEPNSPIFNGDTKEIILNLSTAVKILAEQQKPQTRSLGSQKTIEKKIPPTQSSQPTSNSTPNNPAFGRPIDTSSEEAVSMGIDKIIAWNDTKGRKHDDKIYMGIGSLKKATGRGDKVIRRVLTSDERQAEIEAHHQKHQLTSKHKMRGRTSLDVHSLIDFSDCWSDSYRKKMEEQ